MKNGEIEPRLIWFAGDKLYGERANMINMEILKQCRTDGVLFEDAASHN